MAHSAYSTTYHRDGTVTIWDSYSQSWTRIEATELVREGGRIMATLSDAERQRIERMAAREAGATGNAEGRGKHAEPAENPRMRTQCCECESARCP